MNKDTSFLIILLILMGAGWGATQPLAKIAVSEGYRNFGIIFWQMFIGVVSLGLFLLIRNRWSKFGRSQFIFAAFIAMVGTIIPNAASYQAAVHLPAGVLSIIIAAVPMIAFPIAIGLRLEKFSLTRLAGLILGLASVVLLISPGTLQIPSGSFWVLVALLGPTLYAIEGNSVAKLGTFGLDAVEVLFWASVIGTVVSVPLSIASDTWINPITEWNAPEWAILAGSLLHAVVYATYVWMVSRAGPVFAGQVSYLVTGFGVVWAILFLGESYSSVIWIALLIMAVGMFLVQPVERSDGTPNQ